MARTPGVEPVTPNSSLDSKQSALAKLFKWLRPKDIAEADQIMTNRLEAAHKKLLEQIEEDQE